MKKTTEQANHKSLQGQLPTLYYEPEFEWSFLHPRYWSIWLLILLLAICAILPRRVAHAIGSAMGDVFYKVNKKRRHIASTNIKMCFPKLTDAQRYEMLRSHFRLYGQNFIDLGLFWWAPFWRLQHLTYIRGINHYMNLVNRGENIILLTPHAIGIDYAGIYASKISSGVSMMKALKNPLLNWFVCKGRSRFGAKMILREMGLKPMVRAIKRKIVCYYIPDEDFGPDLSIFVPFFGVPSATLPVLGRMAKMTNAKVVPVITKFLPNGKGYEINFLKPLDDFPSNDELEDTRRMNQALEELIRLAPEQYMWTLKWFKTRPDSKPSPYQY